MSNMKNDFLFELGTEELPPKAIKNLAESLVLSVEKQLLELKIDFDEVQWFASPRRLAFIIKGLAESQDNIVIEKQGPLLSIAYDEKKSEPTRVGLGFAKSCGVDLKEIGTISTPKGDKLFYKAIQQGQKSTELLQEIITKALKQLPIPKMMRWGNSDAEFIRPVHWVVAMYDSKVVNIEILGHKASNITYGHRFHCPKTITINSINEYIEKLENAMVIADWQQRKQMIIEQANKIANDNDYKVVLDDDLVEEVCAIVEYPNAMMCSFDENFLRVPQEALISSMQEHQKCFPLLDKQGKLVANFITVSNIKSTKPELVISGNQKVMNARLSDAAFFYDTDLKNSLDDGLLPKLKSVTFQSQLGNMYQKAQRMAKIAQELAKLNESDSELAYRAGLLAKADLVSNMVFEFSDLQGIIGKYYAKAFGESDIVAEAIEQQYWPKYSGAKLPHSNIASCVALADKLDTLVGIFGIGNKPTGNKDPFALRRAAIGILRILRNINLDISLGSVIDIAIYSYKSINNIEFKANLNQEIVNFCLDRLKNFYKEEGVSVDIFDAVNNTSYESIKDFDARVKAVIDFIKTKRSKSLVSSNKRVSNILSKNSQDIIKNYDISIAESIGNKYELNLANHIIKVTDELRILVSKKYYSEALELFATLDEVINHFFDNVMVMDENPKIKENRIAMLKDLHSLFISVADISRLD